MPKFAPVALSAAALLALANAASAATIARFTFENTTAPVATGTNVTVSPVTSRDANANTTFSSGRSGQSFSANTFADADNNAFNFSVTVDDGFELDLTSLEGFVRASNTGPRNSTLFVNGTSAGGFTNVAETFTRGNFDLSSFADLTGTVTFSLVGTGPAAKSGSNFANTGTLRLDDLLIEGVVSQIPSAIPEPAALGFGGGGDAGGPGPPPPGLSGRTSEPARCAGRAAASRRPDAFAPAVLAQT